jgi:hypothetical protein
MVKIKGGGINYGDLITNIIKYGVLIALFGICIRYIHVANVQFIIFVVLLITIVLGSAIVIKDLSDLSSFMNIVKPNDSKEFSIEKPNPSFFQLFMGVIGVAAIMKIISLTFFILTFNKGREELKSKDYSKVKQLSSQNLSILNDYVEHFIISLMLIISLIITIFVMYGTIETQIIMKNLTGIMLCIAILTLVSLEMYNSVKFLRIKENNGLLYEITVPDTIPSNP